MRNMLGTLICHTNCNISFLYGKQLGKQLSPPEIYTESIVTGTLG